MKRSRRLRKKLHKQYLIDVATDVVMDKAITNILWNLKQGASFSLNFQEYHQSQILSKYNLSYIVKRGPIDGLWPNGEYDSSELVLVFYSEEFPQYYHQWLLYEE